MAPRGLALAVALAAGAFTNTVPASPAQDYTLYCMGCHGAQAQGVPGKIPPLAGSVSLYMRIPEGRDYVLRVEELAGAQVSCIGVGPGREQTIVRRDVLAARP